MLDEEGGERLQGIGGHLILPQHGLHQLDRLLLIHSKEVLQLVGRKVQNVQNPLVVQLREKLQNKGRIQQLVQV